MNILFYRYGSICEPDIKEAFETLGHSVMEEATEIKDKTVSPSQMLENVSCLLYSHNFDCIFSVNFYPVLSELCNIFHIRYLCWTVDSPILELYSYSAKNAWNRIFLFDYAQYKEFVPVNPNCIFYLPLATNVNRWAGVFSDSANPNQNRFQNDISFVGSLYTEKSPYDQAVLPEYLRGYLEGLMAMQEQIYGDYLIEPLLSDEMVSDFKAHYTGFYRFPEQSVHNNKAVLAQLYLGNKITSNERIHLLAALGSRFTVDLYTGSSKLNLPVRWNGRVTTHYEMPFVFRNSRINLNTTVRGIRTGIPLRIWDILGCGGFLLTNYQAELQEYFKQGEDLDIFSSSDELLEKADYYLTHEAQRKEMAHHAFVTVKENHTYIHRIEEMIRIAFL